MNHQKRRVVRILTDASERRARKTADLSAVLVTGRKPTHTAPRSFVAADNLLARNGEKALA
jgi:hypothetical protein